MAAKGTWGASEAIAALKNLNKTMQANMTIAMRENAIHMRDALVRRVTEGDNTWPPNAPLTIAHKGSSKPLIDHGDLRMGIRAIHLPGAYLPVFFAGIPRQDGKGGELGLMRIALVQEFGAIIRPRRARMLAIPASREADRLTHENGGIRNIPGLFRPRGTGGRMMNVLCVKSANGSLKVLFILKRQTIIQPRPFISRVWQEEKPKCILRIQAAARATLQGRAYRGQLA